MGIYLVLRIARAPSCKTIRRIVKSGDLLAGGSGIFGTPGHSFLGKSGDGQGYLRRESGEDGCKSTCTNGTCPRLMTTPLSDDSLLRKASFLVVKVCNADGRPRERSLVSQAGAFRKLT